MTKLRSLYLTLLTAFFSFLFPSAAYAALDPRTGSGAQNGSGGLKNPVINNLGNSPTEASEGTTFVNYFITIWRALISVGSLIVLVFFLWAAIEWILAGADAGKVQKARDKMTNAVIGLIILVGSFVIVGFIGQLFFGENFNILQLTFPTPE